MNGYYKQVVALLTDHGFCQIRSGKGSHQIWGKGSIRVVVSVNCASKFTANAIMKQAGINHKF